MSILSRKIGIDLGSSSVLIHVRGEGIVVNEPSVAAVNGHGARVVAVGTRARELARDSAAGVQLVRPVHDGAIVDLAATQAMLQHLVARVQGRQWLFKPEVMVCVPSAAGSTERRAVTGAAVAAGAGQAWLIDQPLAAAIGAELAVGDRRASAVCHVGAGTTEVAVIAQWGLVVVRSLRVAGNRIDEAIARHVKARHDLVIDEVTAEGVKIEAGSAIRLDRPLVARLSCGVEITSNHIATAIQEPLQQIAAAVRAVLAETPPTLAADVANRGLVLTGGGAQLRGLDRFLSAQLGLSVAVAREPQTSAVRGTGAALHDFEVLKRNQTYLR